MKNIYFVVGLGLQLLTIPSFSPDHFSVSR
jgi:hypothetical protein